MHAFFYEKYIKENYINLNIFRLISPNSDFPHGVAGKEGAEVAGFFSGADEADLDGLGVELDELEDVEVSGVGVQVIEDLLVGREVHVVPLSPRKVRELVVATRGLEPGRLVRAVPPDPSDRVGGLEDHRQVPRQLLSRRDAANAAPDDADFT